MKRVTMALQVAAMALLGGCASTDWREDAGLRPADLPECQVGRGSGPSRTSAMPTVNDRRCDPQPTGRGRQAPVKLDFDK